MNNNLEEILILLAKYDVTHFEGYGFSLSRELGEYEDDDGGSREDKPLEVVK